MYEHLKGIRFAEVFSDQVELLIGAATPAAHRVYETRTGFPNQPCALKIGLGCALFGPDKHLKPYKGESEHSVCFARYEQCDLQEKLQQLFNQYLPMNRMVIQDCRWMTKRF